MKVEVSVLLPAYNAESYLKESIDSVLFQSYSNFELILINDGSQDNTLKIMEEYARKDRRIIIDSHDNIGMGNSLNWAMEFAKGDFIVRMDADDIMLPNRIEKQINFMKNNPDISVASCLAYYINSKGEVIGKTFSDIKTKDDCKKYLINNEPIGIFHPGVIFRKKDILDVGGYRNKFWPADDIDLWNRLLEQGKYIVVMQEVLMKYRIHGDSIITDKFLEARKKFEWVRECMYLRRAGKKEISWEEFLKNYDKIPLLEKINKLRKNYAKFFYRTAGFSFASSEYFKFISKLLLALLLQPEYVIKKLFHQKIKG